MKETFNFYITKCNATRVFRNHEDQVEKLIDNMEMKTI